MRVTASALAGMFDAVRVVNPTESDALLSPPRPRLMATTARVQTVLRESGLLTAPLPLEPIFEWPVGVDSGACRG
jgi:hypothetical protein